MVSIEIIAHQKIVIVKSSKRSQDTVTMRSGHRPNIKALLNALPIMFAFTVVQSNHYEAKKLGPHAFVARTVRCTRLHFREETCGGREKYI